MNGGDYRPSRKGGFSYCEIGARVQRNSSTVIRIWKQWTDEHRTIRKAVNGQWKMTSVRDDRDLLRIELNDRTASSRQLTARWSTATGVLMSASPIRRRLLHRVLRARVPLYRIPFTFKPSMAASAMGSRAQSLAS
ncbi:transposable element Tc1 transposase [Trichonephila clavipes]|nr:transposable element Tc1 transposase [Trichonephila clavipes]